MGAVVSHEQRVFIVNHTRKLIRVADIKHISTGILKTIQTAVAVYGWSMDDDVDAFVYKNNVKDPAFYLTIKVLIFEKGYHLREGNRSEFPDDWW